MIQLTNLSENQRFVELGGGANPKVRAGIDVRVDVRMCYNEKGEQTVDFIADFNEPLPIKSDEFDGLFSQYTIEHLSWRKVKLFLSECFRIVKEGAKVVFITANVESQFEWIRNNRNGWDEKSPFESFSCVIFGDQDYPENTHRNYMSPDLIKELLEKSGFDSIQIQPYGERKTDMVVQVNKPFKTQNATLLESMLTSVKTAANATSQPQPTETLNNKTQSIFEKYTREELYSKDYFNGGKIFGGYAREGYWDFPVHAVTLNHILRRKPKSVLELGCLIQDSPIVCDSGVCKIQDLEPGQKVYTHQGTFETVERLSIRPYQGEIICIQSKYASKLPLKLTPDHPVYAIKVHRQFKSWKPDIVGVPEWIPAKNLNKDDYWLVYPKVKKTENLDIDSGLARLSGYYLSEGRVQKKENKTAKNTGYVVSFCLHEKETSYLQDIRSLMKKHFGTTDGWTEKGSNKGIKICFYSKQGYHFFKGTFGSGAKNKYIPQSWISGVSDESLQQLILGCYRGDGTKYNKDTEPQFKFTYGTVSFSLAVSFRLVLFRLGYFASISKHAERQESFNEKLGRAIKGGEHYKVVSTGIHSYKLSKLVEQNVEPNKDGRNYWYGREDENNYYIPIKSVQIEQYNGAVYNMDVQNQHSYSHACVIVHNCSRGYILKRLQDKGIPACGLEISKHCWMTRVCDGIINKDICTFPWPWKDQEFDLCYSIAFFEHIPEEFLPRVVSEIKRVSRRSLHGVDFGQHDDGFDKTHCTFHEKSWWENLFGNDRDYVTEIVDKEDLERGDFPGNINDGLLKLNIGSFTTMFHDGWLNIDIHSLEQFAQANAYKFAKHDIRSGLPFGTGTVDYIFTSHCLEHLSFKEGRQFLNDCRRVLNPRSGYMRILVPDAKLLSDIYANYPEGLLEFEHISDGISKNNTNAENLYALLHENHQSLYDAESLESVLKSCNFEYAKQIPFRETEREVGQQVLRETIDMFPCLSLIVEATPQSNN